MREVLVTQGVRAELGSNLLRNLIAPKVDALARVAEQHVEMLDHNLLERHVGRQRRALGHVAQQLAEHPLVAARNHLDQQHVGPRGAAQQRAQQADAANVDALPMERVHEVHQLIQLGALAAKHVGERRQNVGLHK